MMSAALTRACRCGGGSTRRPRARELPRARDGVDGSGGRARQQRLDRVDRARPVAETIALHCDVHERAYLRELRTVHALRPRELEQDLG